MVKGSCKSHQLLVAHHLMLVEFYNTRKRPTLVIISWKSSTFAASLSQLFVKEKSKRKSRVPALVLSGCLVAGVLAGLVFKNLLSGTLIGLGAGFIAMAGLRFIFTARRHTKIKKQNAMDKKDFPIDS